MPHAQCLFFTVQLINMFSRCFSYLLNPFTIASCVAQSTGLVTNLSLTFSMYFAFLGKLFDPSFSLKINDSFKLERTIVICLVDRNSIIIEMTAC